MCEKQLVSVSFFISAPVKTAFFCTSFIKLCDIFTLFDFSSRPKSLHKLKTHILLIHYWAHKKTRKFLGTNEIKQSIPTITPLTEAGKVTYFMYKKIPKI